PAVPSVKPSDETSTRKRLSPATWKRSMKPEKRSQRARAFTPSVKNVWPRRASRSRKRRRSGPTFWIFSGTFGFLSATLRPSKLDARSRLMRWANLGQNEQFSPHYPRLGEAELAGNAGEGKGQINLWRSSWVVWLNEVVYPGLRHRV